MKREIELKLNSRDVEYFLKCPLRYWINKEAKADYNLEYKKIMDSVFATFIIRLITELHPSKPILYRSFLDRLKKNINKDDIVEQYYSKGLPILDKFFDFMLLLEKDYKIRKVPTYIDYMSLGLTISVSVPLIVSSIKSSYPNTRFILLDFEDTTKRWNSYSKLWSSVVYNALLEQDITLIDTVSVHLQTGKSKIITPGESSMINLIIESVAHVIANRLVYPVYGGHCNSCIYQNECSKHVSV